MKIAAGIIITLIVVFGVAMFASCNVAGLYDKNNKL